MAASFAKASAESVANRDAAIPMLRASTSSNHAVDSSEQRDFAPGSSLQSHIFIRIFSQLLPGAIDAEDATAHHGANDEDAIERPNFSLPLMSANFRRFNARIGVVFVFQAQVIRLLSWEQPSHTLSLLAVYTFCCLNPALILTTPLLACLFFIMVPAFLARHPSPPEGEPGDIFQIKGPASAPPKVIKPAPDMSKDFFRNMRDLQNSMEDFSVIHDHVVSAMGPITNFSSEKLSSFVFLALFLASGLVCICARAIPWQAVALCGGWILIGSSHPLLAGGILEVVRSELTKRHTAAIIHVHNIAEKDVALDEPPESRQVEIFELQKRQAGSEWQAWVYSPSPYDPQSPRRISGERPKGTPFFEDILAPRGWEWKDKKWALDVGSREWVEERLITAVEIETEGDRWVYDISASEYADRVSSQAWEEGSGQNLSGEWRRRRWVRLVSRQRH